MLTQEIAKEIVAQTMIRLNRNINIMDEQGTIIASGNVKRINQAHFGAKEVLRTGKPLIISKDDSQQWDGALPGINLPIQFQNDIIGVIGITGNPEEIMEFGELVKMITEMMIQQSFLTEQIEWKQRLIELVFEDLLTDSSQPELIKQRLNLIGVTLEAPYQVGAIELGSHHLKKNELLQIFRDSFNKQQTLIGFLNVNRLFILTSHLPEERLKQKMLNVISILKAKGISLRVGTGSTVFIQAHIRHSFEEALSSLKFGNLEQTFITYNEIETKALLDQLDERAKQQFSKRILSNLPDKLIDTLEHFFACNLNIGECAKEMYIHRNSLIYRIKKVKEKTGYDPQNIHDAMTLQLAIWILQMLPKE
ncbi:CdaR family transcriptional regulator [Peribacillus asahii]|uniref:CdaR family transcriptional regulator n=1 Tax=Peribacillus asahii TaxID=228899 RepID=UPI002079F28A|nr:sugar diacid recognition domain-containing protein [Peribacillus asahii]USK61434.1 helix-turn-helix domain-containing protein [Peribacillus asahii]